MGRKARGRPREFDEQTVLTQLRERFWERGFSATSLDDLSSASGLGRPSLYSAFGDKESMYLAALEQFFGELRFGLRSLREVATCRQGLERVLRRALAIYLAGAQGPRGCLAVCTATPEAVEHPRIREALVAILRELDESLIAMFERFCSSGAEAARKGRIAQAVLHSLAVRSRAGQSRELLEEMIDDALELLTPSGA